MRSGRAQHGPESQTRSRTILWMRPARLVLAAALLPGCAVFFTDLDGFSGGEDVADAGLDSATEANVSVDAGSDAAPGRCARESHAACFDFDDGSSLEALGFSVDRRNAGSVAVEPGVAASTPNALRVVVPRRPDDAQGNTQRANRVFAEPVDKVHVELDLWVEPIAFEGNDSTSHFLWFQLRSSSGNTIVYLTLSRGGLALSHEVGTDPRGPLPPFGKWTRLVVDFSAATFRVAYDGTTLERPLLPGAAAGAEFTLGLGVTQFNKPVPALDLRYDEVTVDFPP